MSNKRFARLGAIIGAAVILVVIAALFMIIKDGGKIEVTEDGADNAEREVVTPEEETPISQAGEVSQIQKHIHIYSYAGHDPNDANPEFGETDTFISNVSDDSYDWVAIGNSITLQQPMDANGDGADDWRGYYGAAASSEDKDYVHLTGDMIYERVGGLNALAYKFRAWEDEPPGSRANVLSELDSILVSGVDLVTVDLGENCNRDIDKNVFEADFLSLLQYIKSKVPDAQIIVIGDFYSNPKLGGKGARAELEHKAADAVGAAFVDVEDMEDNPDYMAFSVSPAIATDENGDEYEMTESAILWHPSDLGMSVIAERLFERVDVSGYRRR